MRQGLRVAGLAALADLLLAGVLGTLFGGMLAAREGQRVALGRAGEAGWIPGEVTTVPETLAEAAWLLLLAWRGLPAAPCGPLVAPAVATTRIGGHGPALVPLLWEETLREALRLCMNLLAGIAADLLVVLLAGWCLAIGAGPGARRVAPTRSMAVLAVPAAVWHMRRLCPACL